MRCEIIILPGTEENNPIIGAGLTTQLTVQKTWPKFQYVSGIANMVIPNPTANLTYYTPLKPNYIPGKRQFVKSLHL